MLNKNRIHAFGCNTQEQITSEEMYNFPSNLIFGSEQVKFRFFNTYSIKKGFYEIPRSGSASCQYIEIVHFIIPIGYNVILYSQVLGTTFFYHNLRAD